MVWSCGPLRGRTHAKKKALYSELSQATPTWIAITLNKLPKTHLKSFPLILAHWKILNQMGVGWRKRIASGAKILDKTELHMLNWKHFFYKWEAITLLFFLKWFWYLYFGSYESRFFAMFAGNLVVVLASFFYLHFLLVVPIQKEKCLLFRICTSFFSFL